ncbi:MAG: 16S rRNA (guanine(966)-N(2))-methyltransferase RsmD [candidate division WOR-3 bacterium]|nr:MAG: 16S rRNA (guanine(966)-N(2))-methyltransferase RsmD [candidate division WOR-3 bacterium]
MRIVGGLNKGSRLRVSKRGVRPTKAIVREAIFNIIGNLIPGADVLDIFAGSGALGLESISRGAQHCVFIDKNTSTLKKNIVALNVSDKCRIIKADFVHGIRRLRSVSFDIIFLDPPYHGSYIERTMNAIGKYNILRANGIVVAEHGIDQAITVPPEFIVSKKRTYGDTAVLFISSPNSESEEHTGASFSQMRS